MTGQAMNGEAAIEILSPGPLASVQDLGRHGCLALGVGRSGAMDPLALTLANRLVGNEAGIAGIEFTLGAFALRFHADAVFALTGADCRATLDGLALPPLWCMTARAGQVLKGGAARGGMRSYLAVAGGFRVAPVLGSASTDLKGGFGGWEGRALRPGDRLPLRAAGRAVPHCDWGLAPESLAALCGPADAPIRVVAAAEYGLFDAAARRDLVEAEWTIQPDSNRVGYRLAGPALALTRRVELLSHGILPGTIQVPPSGQPVIQLSDANTCGGYPKIGAVIGADLWRLGQARLGSRLRFALVERAAAVAALRRQALAAEALFARLDRARRAVA
ncbi:biotin-dependent carboxyltransferase family protein [Roseomonas sp. NAR14]|uniref:Biotin-dependent carboxyltransferase family protein n=1 Tax=Roseomonas acroporae TaxID=2937791 RepID=A0A9X1YDI7_9PROT|nr:biotin-dependent carboxyltransferase family protein [Roseomonas acroporae]MCK8787780.1 biotin-dependent carboxyltransferase family protein [Roseomonas acroporae]